MGADLFIESISQTIQNEYGELFAKALKQRDALAKEISGTIRANAKADFSRARHSPK
mgnify:CR=1 FL=1